VCIWLARVRPEDCENIIRYTILQGKVVKPERQLRGGFDRSKQVASW
jgi:(2Fe-2S) ferredoxin